MGWPHGGGPSHFRLYATFYPHRSGSACRARAVSIHKTQSAKLAYPESVDCKRDELDTATSVDIPVGMTVLGFKIFALRAAA